MLNNTRICPTCRSPLPTNTCKKCGYKQKILKVAEFHEDFGKINYANKIQSSNREVKFVRLLTSEQKLAFYLKQYQKLLIKAVEKIIEVNQLDITQRQQLRKEVRFIWQNYLMKIRNNSNKVLGILKRPINSQNKRNSKIEYKMEEGIKQIKQSQQEHQDQEVEKQSVKEYNPAKRRGRPKIFQSGEKKQIKAATKLRSYINISVRPLIQESILSRKDDSNELTLAQKSFLSFLLELKEIDQQFLAITGSKYLKLILEIDGNKLQKSFVKQSLITSQAKRRNLKCSKNREKTLNLIILFDILQCHIYAHICEQKIDNIQSLMKRYLKNESNIVIDSLVSLVSKEKPKEQQNIPQISYKLIYSIMYVSACRTGLTITVGEILKSVGALQIAKIFIEDELSLPALLNQQIITSVKVRRMSHLLAKYLNITFPVLIIRWCKKWCVKFDILVHLPKIASLNQIIFKQLFSKGIRKRPNSEDNEKCLNYFRFYELEQDIASLSSLMVYLKMVDGLSDYPYLLNINVELLKKEYNFDQQQIFNSIQKLMKHKKINVQNKSSKQILTKIIPEIYQQPFDLLKFTKKVAHINKNDKLLGKKMANSELVNFRNLSHINGLPSLQILDIFQRFKKNKGQKESEKQIKLRYNQIPHQQWSIQLAKSRKTNPMRIVKQKQKPKIQLSEDIIKQIRCIISEDDTLVNEQSQNKSECLIDEPSTNYQLMYEYSSDKLCLAQRCEQLHVMQQLCLNVCTFNEFCGWLNTYESILKRHQTK